MIVELHIHSQFSHDSLMRPEKVIKAAKDRGLNGIAVTDHDTIKGGLSAQKANEDKGFSVIIGCEVKSNCGDIIGLFLQEEIRSRNCMDVVDEIKEQGGVVVLPHPFRGHKLSEELISAVHAIETFNSRTGKAENDLAKELGRKHNKAEVAGSDAHFYSEIGLARTEIQGNDPEQLRTMILKGRTAVLDDRPSRQYLQDCSQLIKALKLKRYSAVPVLAASASARYLLRY